MTWLLPLMHPTRLASNTAARRAIRELERLALAAGRRLRPKRISESQ